MTANFLPQTSVVLNDLGLKVAPPPAGRKVTLLGITSNTGIPVFEPYTVQSVEQALNSLYFTTYGTENGSTWPKSGNWPGELALAIEEAVNGGAENIEVVVIGHYSGQELLDYIRPDYSKSGRYMDLSGAYDVLGTRDLDIVIPVGAYIDDSTDVASTNFGKQLADFCYQTTSEDNACIGVIGVQPPLSWLWDRRLYLSGNSVISGELISLFGTTPTGGGIHTGNVSSTGNPSAVSAALKAVMFGTPSTTLVSEWVTYHTNTTGVAGYLTSVYNGKDSIYQAWQFGAADQDGNILQNLSTSTDVHANYFASWQATNRDGTVATDSRNGKIDAGAYLSVVSAPLVAVGTQVASLALAVGAPPSSIARTTTGVAGYAGLINSLAPHSATTGKRIGGVQASKTLSKTQANRLTGFRHVTLYTRSTGLSVTKDVTGAHNVSQYRRSDYNLLSTVRIVFDVVDSIRSVGDRYIGEPNNAPQLNAMDNDIEAVLASFAGVGALRGYTYSLSSTPDQRVLGIVEVNLTLEVAYEILEIQLTVSLSKGE